MAARDAARTIPLALASLARQTVCDWECVVIDDGSRDETGKAVRAFGDVRVRLVTQPARGLTAALAIAAIETHAPFLARLDADDEALPERFERQLARFETESGIVAVGTAVEVVVPDGSSVSRVGYPEGHEELVADLDALLTPIPHSTLMLCREAYEDAGGYRAVFAKAQDYDLLRRLARVGRLASIPEPLVRLHLSSGSVTESSANGEQFEYCLLAFVADTVRESSGSDPLDGRGADYFLADFRAWYRASRYPRMFRSRLERRSARVSWTAGRPGRAAAALGRATLQDPVWALRRAGVGGDPAAEARAWALDWVRGAR